MTNKQSVIQLQIPETDLTIKVLMHNDTLWMTQTQLSELFQLHRAGISKHIQDVFSEGDLKKSKDAKLIIVLAPNKRSYKVWHYNLDMIINLACRINSKQGRAFRRWIIQHMKKNFLEEYSFNEKRVIAEKEHFERVSQHIKDIQTSEKRVVKKVLDVFKTSFDYNAKTDTAKEFYAAIQNKIHYAVHQHTVSEIILKRADPYIKHMGLTSWTGCGDIKTADVTIADNYLNEAERRNFEYICNQILLFAEFYCTKHRELTMMEWIRIMDNIIQSSSHVSIKNVPVEPIGNKTIRSVFKLLAQYRSNQKQQGEFCK